MNGKGKENHLIQFRVEKTLEIHKFLSIARIENSYNSIKEFELFNIFILSQSQFEFNLYFLHFATLIFHCSMGTKRNPFPPADQWFSRAE